MTTTKTAKLQPGDVIHFVRSGLLFRTSTSINVASEVSQRGAELVITPEILAAGPDRNGKHSIWDLVDDGAGQTARWGTPGFARGPAPDNLTSYTPGTTEAEVAFSERRTAAWAVADPQERTEALAALKEEFGNPTTSRTIRAERPR